MQDDEADALNLRAYLALSGASRNWRDDLARVMRSDAPLSRMLRNCLADAFENETQEGSRLDLNNHKADRDRFAGVVSRSEWMEIGRWIEEQRQAGLRQETTEAAARHFGIGVKKVEKALTYYNKAKVWVEKAMRTEAGQAMGRDMVEQLYHSIIVMPELKRLNADLLRQLALSH